MPTKKQLAALARGRAIRRENIRKAKNMKRKTKAEYKKTEEKPKEKTKDKPKDTPKEKPTEKSTFKEPTKIILYNGEPLEIPISKIPKGVNKWKKVGRYAKNAAIAAATLGALGYGAYNGKKLYDNVLHYPVDLAIDALKLGAKLFMKGGEIYEQTKDAWNKDDDPGRKIGNVINLYENKGVKLYKKIFGKRKRKDDSDDDYDD